MNVQLILRRGIPSALALGLALVLVGCGSGVSVKGKVTFDGSAVDNGAITLIPTGDGAKVGSYIKDGEYEIDAKKGLKPGTYKVEIIWAKKTGKKIPEEVGSPEHMTEETKQVIPAKYNTKTTLEVTLSAGENRDKDFALTK